MPRKEKHPLKNDWRAFDNARFDAQEIEQTWLPQAKAKTARLKGELAKLRPFLEASSSPVNDANLSRSFSEQSFAGSFASNSFARSASEQNLNLEGEKRSFSSPAPSSPSNTSFTQTKEVATALAHSANKEALSPLNMSFVQDEEVGTATLAHSTDKKRETPSPAWQRKQDLEHQLRQERRKHQKLLAEIEKTQAALDSNAVEADSQVNTESPAAHTKKQRPTLKPSDVLPLEGQVPVQESKEVIDPELGERLFDPLPDERRVSPRRLLEGTRTPPQRLAEDGLPPAIPSSVSVSEVVAPLPLGADPEGDLNLQGKSEKTAPTPSLENGPPSVSQAKAPTSATRSEGNSHPREQTQPVQTSVLLHQELLTKHKTQRPHSTQSSAKNKPLTPEQEQQARWTQLRYGAGPAR